jgi:hypothetical protein
MPTVEQRDAGLLEEALRMGQPQLRGVNPGEMRRQGKRTLTADDRRT